MMSQQGVVMTSRSVDTSGSAGMGGEDVNTRKILTQLQEMVRQLMIRTKNTF